MIKNNEFINMIQVREKALDYKIEKEKRYIKKMFKSRQFSPRTYTQKKEQLEKWVQLEMQEIEKSKQKYEEEWERAVHMVDEN